MSESERKALRTSITDRFFYRSVADELVAIARDKAELFHDADNVPFATFKVGEHDETHPLRSRGFTGWLRRQFYDATGRTAGGQAAADALGTLDGIAQYDGEERRVGVRVAGTDSVLYLDLGDPAWRVVEVTAKGWRVLDRSPVRFRRSRGMLALPEPVRGGSLAELWPFVNIPNDETRPLVLGFLLAALRQKGPYPILILEGEQGSAKSSTARKLRALLDPASVPLRTLPKEERDLAISARNAWMLGFDNLSDLPRAMSNAICRLSTGGGLGTRELYTNDEEALFDVTRSVILNGIGDYADAPDLLDRSIVARLPRIEDKQRKTERELDEAFATAHPRILGALLDAVSSALARLPSVKLDRLPRMADFATWATAGEAHLGLPEKKTFVDVFATNRADAVEAGLDQDQLAAAVRDFAAEVVDWKGTAGELLAVLDKRVGEDAKRRKGWPTGPRALSTALRRLGPPLRSVGVEVSPGGREGKDRRRLWRVYLTGSPGGERSPAQRVWTETLDRGGSRTETWEKWSGPEVAEELDRARGRVAKALGHPWKATPKRKTVKRG